MSPISAPNPRRWLGLVFINLSLLIVSLDDTVMNVALPSIARELNATTSDLQWIVDGYILVFASLLLAMGSLGDRFGRKRLLQVGVLLFGACSLLAAFSRTAGMLVAARALLGVGGAIIMPSTLSLISALFPDSKERGRAIAIWTAMFGLGGGLGPLAGGWLLEHFRWSAIFYLNIPIVVLAFLGGHFLLPESRDENAPPPDLPGVLLSSLGLLALVYAIVEAGSGPWTFLQVTLPFAVFVVLLVVFLWWEKRAPNAMLPLELFKNMSFTVPSITMMITIFGMMSVFFLMTQFFQGVQGYSPLETGIMLLPQALLSIIVSTNSAAVVNRLGLKRAVLGGLALAAAGLLMLGWIAAPDTSYWLILASLMIMFTGIDTAMPATTMSIMSSVPTAKAGVGSAMNEMTGQIGGALGIAIMGSVANMAYKARVGVLQSELPADIYAQVYSSLFGAYQAAGQLAGEVARQVIDISELAFVAGMRSSIFLGVAVLLATILMVAIWMPRTDPDSAR